MNHPRNIKELTKRINSLRVSLVVRKKKPRSEVLRLLKLPSDFTHPLLPSHSVVTLSEYNEFARAYLDEHKNGNKIGSVGISLHSDTAEPREVEIVTDIPLDTKRIQLARTQQAIDELALEEQDLTYVSKATREHPAWRIVGTIKNPRQKATLFNFQIKEALKNLYLFLGPVNHRCRLTVAAPGTGKTFIAGQEMRWIRDIGWDIKSSLGPYKIIYITYSNVVEQSSRVFRDLFGLRIPQDVLVTSYSQLRSNFGKKFIEEKTVIMGGEPHTQLIWHEGIHPAVIILDEIQAAKNETSKQSKLIQSLARLKDGNIFPVKVHAMSATPFTRVIEAKALVLNMHIPYDPYKQLGV